MSKFTTLSMDELIDLLTKKTMRYNELLKKHGEMILGGVDVSEYDQLKSEMAELRDEIQIKKAQQTAGK